MYIFVNTSLGMGKGKIGAQVGHVVQMVIEDLLLKNNVTQQDLMAYPRWKSSGMAKIVLKASQEEMDRLILLPHARYVRDAGRTQIPSGSLTAISFPPTADGSPFSHYKLL